MLVLRASSSWNSTTLWTHREQQDPDPALRASGPPPSVLGQGLQVLRVVLMDVDVVERGLLQAEHVDHRPVEDVVGLCEELVKAPALLLVRLQDVGQHRGQEALQTPEEDNTGSRLAHPSPTYPIPA